MSARLRLALPAALVFGLLAASPARAQEAVASVPATSAPVAAPAASPDAAPATIAPAGPTLGAATVGVRNQVTAETPAPQRRGRNAPGVALMVVGGAALLVGLIISGEVGAVIAVAGAVTGLYGLYQYLQ